MHAHAHLGQVSAGRQHHYQQHQLSDGWSLAAERTTSLPPQHIQLSGRLRGGRWS